MKNSNLNDCPFCNGKATIDRDAVVSQNPFFVIQCTKCKVCLANDDEIAAVTAWNTRYTCPDKKDIAALTDQIISDYKQHYDFPQQGESHMRDCITDDLRQFKLSQPFNDGFCTDKKVQFLLESGAELVGAIMINAEQYAVIVKGDVRWFPTSHLSGSAPRISQTINEVRLEIEKARTAWPPFNSAHEGFGVLSEEVDELWDEVKIKQKNRDLGKMRKEAIQVAAMAIRFADEVCDEINGRK